MSHSVLTTIDIGNSAIKAGLFAEDQIREATTLNSIEEVFAHISTWNTATPICRIGMSSVVPEQTEIFISGISELIDVPIFQVSSHVHLPIRLNYNPTENLGTDRIAAACAAWYPGGHSQIIVDAGTAITIDVVSTDGIFLGGMIMPSPSLSNHALANYTAKLPDVPLTLPHGAFGNSTVEAMQHGLIHGMIDGVLGGIDRIKRHLHSPPMITLTGGWCQTLTEKIPHAKVNRNLVLHGIRLLMQFNPCIAASTYLAGEKPTKDALMHER